MTLILSSSSESSFQLWLHEKDYKLPYILSSFIARALSLYRNLTVFLRKSLVLLQNILCGKTELCCPYTEISMSFYERSSSYISNAYLKFTDFSLTYVSKYINSVLLTTTGKHLLSLHRSVVSLKQGVSNAK